MLHIQLSELLKQGTCAAAIITFAMAGPAVSEAVATGTAIDLPGYDHVMIDAAHRPRVMEASVWYPAGSTTYVVPIGANPVFTGTEVMLAPNIAAMTDSKKRPLIVISHGSGGNIDGLGWLAGALAQRGAIVVGVNHPGTTSRDSSARRTVQVTERARDIPAMIDTMLAHPDFGPMIDPEQISVLGFSLGGATALHVAGAQMQRAAYGQYCDTVEGASDCGFLTKGGVNVQDLPAEWEAKDMAEPRLSRIVAVDPGFGYAMSDASLAAIGAKVLLVGLGAADTQWAATDAGPEGSDLVGRIPGAVLARLAPAVHFSFLGECTPDGAAILVAEADDPVCDEPAGGDRAALHAQAITVIADFLNLPD